MDARDGPEERRRDGLPRICLFRATADGSRIAFTQGVTVGDDGPTSAPVGVRDTAATANAATLTGTGVTPATR